MDKKTLRARMRALNRGVDPVRRAVASARIWHRVEALPEFARARTVALFVSLGDEPDTEEALARWSAGRTVVLPRVEGDAMRFFRYDPALMRTGAFGIREPAEGAVPCDPAQIDLVVVPGVAFTSAGGRCGRGRGYYDRYLAQPACRAFRVGVCYAHQLAEELPREPHDEAMDVVVTD